MALTVILGIVAGAAAFLPLFAAISGVKHVTKTSNLSHLGVLLLSVAGSLAILIVATAVCIAVARDVVLPFVFGEAAGLVVVAVAFGVRTFVLKKKD